MPCEMATMAFHWRNCTVIGVAAMPANAVNENVLHRAKDRERQSPAMRGCIDYTNGIARPLNMARNHVSVFHLARPIRSSVDFLELASGHRAGSGACQMKHGSQQAIEEYAIAERASIARMSGPSANAFPFARILARRRVREREANTNGQASVYMTFAMENERGASA